MEEHVRGCQNDRQVRRVLVIGESIEVQRRGDEPRQKCDQDGGKQQQAYRHANPLVCDRPEHASGLPLLKVPVKARARKLRASQRTTLRSTESLLAQHSQTRS